MARQIIWWGATLFLALIASLYGFAALQEILFLKHLDKEAPAYISEWRAKEDPDGYFYPYARFTYEVDKQIFQGAGYYKSHYARNPYVLASALHDLAERSFTVYYNSVKPEEALLEKRYPLKNLIKSFVATALCLYFLYLKKQQRNKFLKLSL